jgi:hypothetical protein
MIKESLFAGEEREAKLNKLGDTLVATFMPQRLPGQ